MSHNFDFDEEQYQTFIRRLEQEFIITILIEMKGGYSGARTSLVQIEARNLSNTHNIKKGKYILKVCLTEDAEHEKQKHAIAKENDILGQYIPDLVAFISYHEIQLIGILYQIAGEELLTRTTLQEILEQRQTSQKQLEFLIKEIEGLAGTILKWNFETPKTETSDLLGSILQSIGKAHLEELENNLKRIVKNINNARIDLTPIVEVPMYNPIHFLKNIDKYPGTPLRHMPFLIPAGLVGNFHLHGDLHPGNVIVCKTEHSHEPFHVIDFASSRSGNVFFDLAYLEISIILNSRGGFHRQLDLENWWELEQHLVSEYLPSENTFNGAITEGLQRVLPIRSMLDAQIQLDGKRFKDDYWVAFLAASVEVGLDLARKTYYDHTLQRVAFLIAISRFHHIVKLLGAMKSPPRGPMATINWPEEKLSSSRNKRARDRANTPPVVFSPVNEGKVKIPLVWPNEITQREALYDPWRIVDKIWSDLTGLSNQAILLIGERRFGKSSFYNCVSDLFPKQGETLRTIHLDTLGLTHSAQSFAIELLENLCQISEITISSVPYDRKGREFESGSFFSALRFIATKKKTLRYIVCIDEIDSTLEGALSISLEDAKAIVQILYRLWTGHILPVSLLLTANKPDILSLLRRLREGTGFVDNLEIWTIPLCSEPELRELIERFEVSLTFEEEALKRISHYSGGQIYFIKLIVKLVLDANVNQNNQKISAQEIDELMRDVITPSSNTPAAIKNKHTTIFDTMPNIYLTFFSQEEQHFMQLLTKAQGSLRSSNLRIREEQYVNIADGLHRRGYIFKAVSEGEKDEVYSWRIGIWQLFLEEYCQISTTT